VDGDGQLNRDSTALESSDSHSKSLAPIPLVRALLLALILDRPGSTGYDLMKQIVEFTGGDIQLKTGTVYAELRRLEGAGLVLAEQEESGRRRRAYRLTKKGLHTLKSLANQIDHRVNRVLLPLLKIVSQSTEKRRA